MYSFILSLYNVQFVIYKYRESYRELIKFNNKNIKILKNKKKIAMGGLFLSKNLLILLILFGIGQCGSGK